MTLRRTQCHLPAQLLTIWDAFASPSVISLHWVFIGAQTHAVPHYWDSVGETSHATVRSMLWLTPMIAGETTDNTSGWISANAFMDSALKAHILNDVSYITITWVIFPRTNISD